MPVFGRGRINRQQISKLGTRVVRAPKARKYKPQHHWQFENEPLRAVEFNLGFSIRGFLRRRTRTWPWQGKKKPLVVLDWGCGAGNAISEIKNRFKEKVQTYGLSVDSYPTWQNNHATAFIQANETDGLRYFKDGSIDLMYSHIGLASLVTPQLVKYIPKLVKKLAVGGVLVGDSGINFAEPVSKRDLNLGPDYKVRVKKDPYFRRSVFIVTRIR